MSTELNKTLARKYFEAYSTGDIDAVMKFVGSSYVLHPGGNGKSMNPVERKADELVFFRAFSNIQAVVEDQIAEDDKVANRITMTCTHAGEYQRIRATGKRIVIPYIDIIQFKAGKIVEEWVEYDTANILKQIKP
jgi:predicted ester cyclase